MSQRGTQTRNLLALIESRFGIPADLAEARAAADRLSTWANRSMTPEREQAARRAAVGAAMVAARRGTEPDEGFANAIAEAAAADAADAATRATLREAAAEAVDDLVSLAAVHADEIVTHHLRPAVEQALECLPEAAERVPAGLDDAGAFRAGGDVASAWRALSAAADTVGAALDVRRRMINPAAEPIDDVEPPDLYGPGYSGGLAYGLVRNAGDLIHAGTWPRPELAPAHRLVALYRAGAVFHFATSAEASAAHRAAVVKDRERREAQPTTPPHRAAVAV